MSQTDTPVYFSDYRNRNNSLRNSQLVPPRTAENAGKYQELYDNPDTQNATFISCLPRQQDDGGSGGMTTDQLHSSVPFRNISKMRYYQYLDWLNQASVIHPYHKKKNINNQFFTHSINRHACQAFCSQVELNPIQFARVYHEFMQFNLKLVGEVAEIALFGVCAVTLHQDEESTRKYHPNQRKEDRDETLRLLVDQLTEIPDVTEKKLHGFYRKYEQHLVTGCLEGKQRLDYFAHEPPSEDLRPTPVDLRV